MTPDHIFLLCNTIALLSWVVLIVLSPFWPHTDKLLIGGVVTLLAVVYAWCISGTLRPEDFEKFSTLDGLMGLFSSKMAVTAGWIHYLAFDLMTGLWIRNNSVKHGLKHWTIIPSLLLTFMMGPVGLLLYLLIRTVKTKTYLADNY